MLAESPRPGRRIVLLAAACLALMFVLPAAASAVGFVQTDERVLAVSDPTQLHFRTSVSAQPEFGQTVTGVSYTVNLPSGVLYTHATLPGATCSATGQVVTCNRGDVTNYYTQMLDVYATTTPVGPRPIRYRATVVGSATSPINPTSGSTTDAVLAPVGSVNVNLDYASIDSHGASWQLTSGDTGGVSLIVQNHGPTTTTAADVVTTTLPDNVVWEGDAGRNCTHVGADVTCPIDDIDPGDTLYLEFDVRAVAIDDDAIRFEASTAAPDWDTDDDVYSLPVSVVDGATADVEVYLHDPVKRQPRNDVRRTGSVRNSGPGIATGVQTTITYPTGAVPIGAPTIEDGTCTVPAGGTSICTIASVLPSQYKTVTVRYDASAISGGSGVDALSVLSGATDPDPSNNTSSLTRSYYDPASYDRALNNVYTNAYLAQVGAPFERRFLVENYGPANTPATSLTFAADEPVVTITSIDAPAGITCPAPPAASVVCSVAPMLASASAASIVVHYTSSAPGTPILTATLAPDASDADADNDSVGTGSRIVPVGSVNLGVNLDTPTPLVAETGGSQVQPIAVRNAGPATAPTGSTLEYTTSPEHTVTTATIPGGSCTITAGGTHVTCTLPPLVAEQSVTAMLDVLGGPTPGEGTASATITAPAGTVDWYPESNTSAVVDFEIAAAGTVDLLTYLRVEQQDGGGGYADTGEAMQASATVYKDGTVNVAHDTLVTFELPTGATYTGLVTGPGGTSCDAAGPIVTCDIGDVDQEIEVSIAFTAPPTMVDGARVVARADTSTPDRRPANDATEETFDVRVGGAVEYEAEFELFDLRNTAGGAMIEQGGTFRITTRLGNTGFNDMLDTAVVFHLPPGATFVGRTDAAPAPACIVTGSDVSCPVGTLAWWENWRYVNVEIAAPNPSGTVHVDWEIETTSPVQEASVYPAAGADIRVVDLDATETGITGYVDAWQDIHVGEPFQVVVEGNQDLIGPSAVAADLTITATLPSSITAGSQLLDDAYSSADVVCSAAGQVVTCTIPASALADWGSGRIVLNLVATSDGTFQIDTSVVDEGGREVDPVAGNSHALDLTIEPPTGTPDVCSNIAGIQATVPAGMTETGGVCTTPAPATPPTSPTQPTQPTPPTPPTPTPPPFDACPNISGAQDRIPAGMAHDAVGRCVQPSIRNDVLHNPDTGGTLDGGAGNDKLYGGTGADILLGGAGLDLLFGGSGTDKLDGGAGNDTLDGGLGADKLLGGEGNDLILGGGGNDVLDGGRGRDAYRAGSGSDLIKAKDGVAGEAINCGSGKDTVIADKGDKPAADCENVRLA